MQIIELLNCLTLCSDLCLTCNTKIWKTYPDSASGLYFSSF